VLGVLAAGATYVPIGFDQPVGRRAEILRTGDVVAALTVDGADMGRRRYGSARYHLPTAVGGTRSSESIGRAGDS
jgi:hypothetical protein